LGRSKGFGEGIYVVSIESSENYGFDCKVLEGVVLYVVVAAVYGFVSSDEHGVVLLSRD
jgi:uncharacterized membrane protein